MKVCKKRCDECLFDPKKRIVQDKRAEEIIRDVVANDTHFICHKSQMRKDGEEVVCRGSYDSHPGQMIRIAERLRVLEFVDPETGEPL